MTMRGAAAIVGFAEIPTRRTYEGRTAMGLMAEASRNAMVDAGIRKEEIDGLVVEGGSFYPAPIGEYMGLNPELRHRRQHDGRERRNGNVRRGDGDSLRPGKHRVGHTLRGA